MDIGEFKWYVDRIIKKKMYKKNKFQTTSLNVNNSVIGEPIEHKIERIVHNNEPITDGAPAIYTERKDGVLPAYDIRTDRFDVAIEAMDVVSKTETAKRQGRIVEMNSKKEADKGEKGDGEAKSTQGTAD